MADSKLKAYREKLFTDLYTNIIPDRVPVYDGFGYEFFAQINGRSLLESEYNFTLESVKSQIDDVMKFAQGDYVAFAPRNPYPIFFKQSLTEMVSNTGMQQHPEVEVMQADEYDKIIKDPFGFSAEELIYRNAQAYSCNFPCASSFPPVSLMPRVLRAPVSRSVTAMHSRSCTSFTRSSSRNN